MSTSLDELKMGAHIEANSLSDITQIAGNPSKYPRNPTEKQKDPLTLYIARVPGSSDIILTTLKPQLKNVTAEDVASSLYYLHLNTEDDARLLADEDDSVIREETTEEFNKIVQKPLPRKALAETARLSLEINREGKLNPEPFGQPALDPTSSNIGRKIQRKGLSPQGQLTQPPNNINGSAQRRPLGPRPLLSEASTERKVLPGAENQPMNPRSQLEDFPAAKLSSESSRSDHSKYESLDTNRSAKPFSITIIRRDLSSGAQWNIGIVVGDGNSRGMKAMSSPNKSFSDISVHITTPGYMPFRNSQMNSHHDKLSEIRNRQDATNDPHAAAPDWGFNRQVRMEGSSFWHRSSKQHQRSRSDISDTRIATSVSSESSVAGLPGGLSSNQGTVDPNDSSSKGYVFLSPWGGRCKFSTGGGGRTLRCKHTLPGPISAGSAGLNPSASSVVSELRFNLPHSAVFNASTTTNNSNPRNMDRGRFSIPKFSHLRNKLSHGTRPPLPPRPHPSSYAALYPSEDEAPPTLPPRLHSEQRAAESSDEQDAPPLPDRSHPFTYNPRPPESEEDEERLDLSIGQEKAGGGNRGKRAKLGKLVIYDEGFKMLDLVVAANMGVWWSIWESDHR